LQLEQIEKQQQEALNEVKLRFFTNITHEFRTPLTLILGPLGDMLTSEKHSADVKNRLSLIHRNAQRLLNLVNQVLTFRKLHTDHEPLKVVHGNLVEFLEEIFLPFQETARMRNIQYEFDTSAPEIEAWFDQDKLEKVFFNLLSNAFKFTADGGHIALLITQNDTSIDIRVRDNGVGIEPEFQEQIFKRFYERSDTRQTMIKGTGIGLAISKQMVALHRGEIAVENNRDEIFHKGTTFTVRLPKGYAHFDEQVEIKQGSSKQPLQHYHPIIPDHSVIASPQIDEIQASSDQLSKLLIVEDNADVRTYIQQVFSDTYQIVIAENGEEGLKEAEKELPDLIISDVMMPKMDGITFCHQIKTTLETSHIPVILLTARTASLFKIEGLKTGADDYLTKPFNPEELRLRVRNTIKSRQEARDKFARVLNFDPKEISITSADEIFLEKALQVVEEQMENYSFNVNQFAFELAISRPLLFTKLKALTGQTPNNFIKTIRLKRAAQLVKTKKMNISEISHKVGFKDPKYFRQCFKKQFEMSPSEYAENSI
jgi:DNA-binding response OmpR family regulator